MRGLIRSQADLVVAGLMLLAVPWLVASLVSSILTLHVEETGYGWRISGPVSLKGFPRKILEVEPDDVIEWIEAKGLPDWRGDKPCGDEVYPRMVFPLSSAPCGAPIFAISTRNIKTRKLDELAAIGWPQGSGFTWQQAQGQYQVTEQGWLYIWYNHSWWLRCQYWSIKGIPAGCEDYDLYPRYYLEESDQKARWEFKILRREQNETRGVLERSS